MIQAYAVADGRLRPLPAPFDDLDEVVWFDLFNPTEAEEAALERAIGVGVPTRDEMQEIEDSSRLYTEDGAAFMTANQQATAIGWLGPRSSTRLPGTRPMFFTRTWAMRSACSRSCA